MKIDFLETKKQIIAGELSPALEALTLQTAGQSTEMEVAMLSSRVMRLAKDRLKGILDPDDERREENAITVSALELLSRIETAFVTEQMVFEPLVFFETGYSSLTPDESRQYVTEFDKSKTRCVGWELRFSMPMLESNYLLTTEWQILIDGTPYTPRATEPIPLERGWMTAYYNYWWGADEIGAWVSGSYTIDIYAKGKKMVSSNFVVV